MAIENPIEGLGNLSKEVGEGGQSLLFGVARFLQQITGDAETAAIFGAFLLFTLSLVRGGATARNHMLYALSLIGIGLGGLVILTGLGSAKAIPGLLSLYEPNPERDWLYKGLTSFEMKDEFTVRFAIREVMQAMIKNKWYALVLLDMVGVGAIMAALVTAVPVKRSSAHLKED